jgi:ABC-type transport system involved in multi-copper enzyme maturation permease subunit
MSEIAGNNDMIGIVLLLLLFGALGFGVHYSVKEKKPTLHLVFMSFIFIFIGFTSFAMVIIRANQNPPMNENEPDTFTELVSYLNREQYGDFPTFKRRFASEPHQQVVYSGYSSDLDFFWRYQMNHMMTRYWLWNYAGRKDWVQESGPNISPFNKIGNFFGAPFNIHFGGETKDSLYGIPFLIGLIGIYFHFRKDWKMASVFMLMFILMDI